MFDRPPSPSRVGLLSASSPLSPSPGDEPNPFESSSLVGGGAGGREAALYDEQEAEAPREEDGTEYVDEYEPSALRDDTSLLHGEQSQQPTSSSSASGGQGSNDLNLV
jgi:hypothetical protein